MCGSQPLTLMISICSAAKVTMTDSTATGTYTFNSDRTFTAVANTMGTATYLFPPQCLTGAGAPTCEEVQSIVQGLLSIIFSSSGATCTSGSTGCDCAIQFQGQASVAGTYTTSGSTLTLAPSTGQPAVSGSYCARGDSLTLTSVMQGMAGTTVLARQ
jgi:hypothetical protein